MCVYVFSFDKYDFCIYVFYKWDSWYFFINFYERNVKYIYFKDIWFIVIYCYLYMYVGGIVVRLIFGCEVY